MQPRDWLLVGALLVLTAWSLWDRWMQAREMDEVRREIERIDARIDGYGWDESLELTRINWRHPGKF